MFSYVFHGLLGLQGMLAAIPFKDIPGPRYSHGIPQPTVGPPRRDLQQRPKVKRKFRHLKGEGRTKASGGEGGKM